MAGRCFLVIQTGTIAAVAVGFSRFLGVVVPAISPTAWVLKPVNLSTDYAISLSLQQLLAILLIVFLTLINSRGLSIGKVDSKHLHFSQDGFTCWP
jgi:APA family basic amino acid/polyamine antiporter